MYPGEMAIILCIGSIVGWLAALYVRDALAGLIGHVAVGTVGAFLEGYATLAALFRFGTAGMIVGAFAGAALLLYLVRIRKWR